ncbi:hypothetical protein GB931_04405 [Modestobacter sp. I12A-02628]|uniref:MucR family transcriptional regulator n=1 Tax=Goekera deserti TaxID=2497753 RepID=A0A7K3WDT7_9ACTN|nr:MucR family transcriptional regulator [Goekera deserti]MPQ97180.1 hypothetical protein [Goekera deserti]NDI46502.1 hypothetical protein [Goekera deserti]NEL54564.1 MucR family transcriptional regulator [Goekera deserti]
MPATPRPPSRCGPPGVDGSGPPSPAGGHLHLWTSPEGHRLHAPFGELTREDSTGRLCCHLCGRWYASLGSHLRAHGWTSDGYRAAMGLASGTPLTGRSLSSSISARQARRYAADPDHRRQLGRGHRMARDGSLAEAARRAARDAAVRPQRDAARRAALDAGRATRREARAARLRARLAEAGSADLATHLRDRHAAGASLAELARETGLGRDRLRAALLEAGVVPRPPGATTPAGRRARAVAADEAAARRVGTDDVRAWLDRRSREGWSVLRLAAAVGHSPPWVRSRLDRTG